MLGEGVDQETIPSVGCSMQSRHDPAQVRQPTILVLDALVPPAICKSGPDAQDIFASLDDGQRADENSISNHPLPPSLPPPRPPPAFPLSPLPPPPRSFPSPCPALASASASRSSSVVPSSPSHSLRQHGNGPIMGRVSPSESRPFSGDISGGSWNPRAFFARDTLKMQRRINKVRSLFSQRDFFALQETHSSAARVEAMRSLFREHNTFWSHCANRKGGLALFMKCSFLSNFSSQNWIHVDDGRVGKLELRGPNGALDIFSCYLNPQSGAARQASVQAIKRNLKPQGEVLTVILGDFSFVEGTNDRWCKTTGSYTGSRDRREASLFK